MADKFDAEIKDLKSVPIPMEGGDGRSMTLRDLAERALLEVLPSEQSLPADQKIARWRIFTKVSGGAAFDSLPTEDRAVIKELIGKVFTTLVVGRAYDIIDPPS